MTSILNHTFNIVESKRKNGILQWSSPISAFIMNTHVKIILLFVIFLNIQTSSCPIKNQYSHLSKIKLLVDTTIFGSLDDILSFYYFSWRLNTGIITWNKEVGEQTPPANIGDSSLDKSEDDNISLAVQLEKLHIATKKGDQITLIEAGLNELEINVCTSKPNIKNARMKHCIGTKVGNTCDVKCRRNHEWNQNPVKCLGGNDPKKEWDLNGAECAYEVYCRDDSNQKVDWYVAYRLPEKLIKNGEKFESSHSFIFITPDRKVLQKVGRAVQNTVALLNDLDGKPTVKYLAYNDDPPPKMDGTCKKAKPIEGHVKGVLVYNTLNKGFFMHHTQPNFPHIQGFIPGYSLLFGQIFVCVTLSSADEIKKVRHHVKNLKPNVYAQRMPDINIHNINGHDPPGLNSITIYSEKRMPFNLFSKAEQVGDIYRLIANKYDEDIYVQSWIRGDGQLSECPEDKKNVQNVENLTIPINVGDTIGRMHVGDWERTQDHSKWLVGQSRKSSLFCAGDLNRVYSHVGKWKDVQSKSGKISTKLVWRWGGGICLDHFEIAKSFRKIVKLVENCPVAATATAA